MATIIKRRCCCQASSQARMARTNDGSDHVHTTEEKNERDKYRPVLSVGLAVVHSSFALTFPRWHSVFSTQSQPRSRAAFISFVPHTLFLAFLRSLLGSLPSFLCSTLSLFPPSFFPSGGRSFTPFILPFSHPTHLPHSTRRVCLLCLAQILTTAIVLPPHNCHTEAKHSALTNDSPCLIHNGQWTHLHG